MAALQWALSLALLTALAAGQSVPCAEPVSVEPIAKFCQDLSKVCVDHEAYVLYGNRHNPRHADFSGVPQIKLDSVHVDYYGFGDVWGTEFLYPHPLMRPATSGEESKELQEPQFSRWCAHARRCCCACTLCCCLLRLRSRCALAAAPHATLRSKASACSCQGARWEQPRARALRQAVQTFRRKCSAPQRAPSVVHSTPANTLTPPTHSNSNSQHPHPHIHTITPAAPSPW